MDYGVYLEQYEVLGRLEHALTHRLPYSLVRVGDGENLVLAQDGVWPMQEVLKEPWAMKANKGLKGTFLPNLALRDQLVASVKKADIVGILPYDDMSIKAPVHLKRMLTDSVFQHYGIKPSAICHACINREWAVSSRFWDLLRGRRVLLATAKPKPIRNILATWPYSIKVTQTLVVERYEQIEETLKQVEAYANSFDIALFSCGVNAVVLAQQTAERTGKAALDFGKASNILLQGRAN